MEGAAWRNYGEGMRERGAVRDGIREALRKREEGGTDRERRSR